MTTIPSQTNRRNNRPGRRGTRGVVGAIALVLAMGFATTLAASSDYRVVIFLLGSVTEPSASQGGSDGTDTGGNDGADGADGSEDGDALGSPMEMVFDVPADTGVELPLHGTSAVEVAWGDAADPVSATQHTFTDAGSYTVRLYGNVDHFGLVNVPADPTATWPGARHLEAVNAWGDLGLTSIRMAFLNAEDLVTIPSALPASVTDAFGAFAGATDFNDPAIAGWDMGNVESIGGMFDTAASFNVDISAWDVSQVRFMNGAFAGASAFNQDLGNWNTPALENLRGVFMGASSFNGTVNGWDTSGVTNMEVAFAQAGAFNQPLDQWNTGSVTNMEAMFLEAGSFNRDLSMWDTADVDRMAYMFDQATAFDQDLSGWCVAQIASQPTAFARDAGFEGTPGRQPPWGSCP